MADGQDIPSTADRNSGSIHVGMKLPRFKAGTNDPSPFSASDMNRLVTIIEALLNPSVVITQAIPDATGNYSPTGVYDISETNSKLSLALSPGQISSGGGTTIISDTFAQSYADYFLTTGGYRVGKWPTLYNVSLDTQFGLSRSFTYGQNTASNALYGQYRTCAVSGQPNENQGVNPEWNSGDAVFFIAFATGLYVEAQDVSDHGVTSGTPIIYQDLNNGARAWTQFYNQSYS